MSAVRISLCLYSQPAAGVFVVCGSRGHIFGICRDLEVGVQSKFSVSFGQNQKSGFESGLILSPFNQFDRPCPWPPDEIACLPDF